MSREDANTYVYDNPSAKSSIATVSVPTTVHITNNLLTRNSKSRSYKTITFRDVTNSGQVVNQGKSYL